MNKTIVVIDGDEQSFIVSAACEERALVYTNVSSGVEVPFKNKTLFKKFMAGTKFDEANFTSVEKQVAEPKQNAFATLKRRINTLREKFNPDSIEIYLSGNNNFRDALPLPKNNDPSKSGRYKGNREGLITPLLREECKEFLRKYHGAVLVHGKEADDMLMMRMYDGFKSGDKIIAVTQDKDALQGCGWLYNFEKDKENKLDAIYLDGTLGTLFYDTTNATPKYNGTGRKWLYWQWLVGDIADNYNPRDIATQLGLKTPRFGEKTAFNALEPLATDKDCIKLVHDTYLSWYGKEPITYVSWEDEEITLDYIGIMQMYFDCAKMLRWEGDFVDVRQMLTKLGII